ncbi:hypothetical protein HYALB_00002123 [Hymenoscyphus albidus]|uniref:DUF726-domain-containing protein n=1 Tax=Hymenoscyphus albidus TaxID=595503 RepID=A0A9N9LMU2_9HELO|nr:hypothetical protein HYALB_00002123 [Hymenoscyphus albidus]
MPESEATTASTEKPAAVGKSGGDVAQVTVAIQEPVELDDFGLPIKKQPIPVPTEADSSDEDELKEGEKHSEKGDVKEAEEGANGHIEGATVLSAKTKASQTNRQQSESDSENDDFKDARSTPNTGAQTLREPLPETKPEQQAPPAAISKLELYEPKEDKKKSDIAPDLEGEMQEMPIVKSDSKESETKGPTDVAAQDEKKEPTPSGHTRQASSKGAGISEWSHQQLAPREEVIPDIEEDEWQTMPAFAPYDMYDDDNKLIAREVTGFDDDNDAYAGLGGAGRGYTRVQLDDDAQSATSLDENTKYLFKEPNGTGAGEDADDDEQRDALSQMQATKDLLTEGQRIAYVGMTRLILSKMLEQVEVAPTTRTAKKETSMSVEAMKMWTQKMMVRLYAHMEISTEEQIMIEQLSEHGVVPSDLSATLMQNARVKNPMAENEKPLPTPSVTSPGHSVHEWDKNWDKSARKMSTSSGPSLKSPRVPETPKLYSEEEAAAPPPAYKQNDGEDLPEVRTPSQLPTTQNIDIDLRWTVLCDLFLTLIADSVYDARSRVLLEKVGENMQVSWLEICRFEKRVTDALEMQQSAEKENWNEDEHKEARRKMALKKRYMMMGLATVGGSLVIGLSAGLLAPVIGAGLAAGFTTIGVAGTSGFLAGSAGAAIITSGAAASGGVIAVRAANRRTGAVQTFEYRPLHNNKRVNLIVTVSGWMTGKVDDVRLPYSTVDPIMGDIYSVLWEPEMLRSMGDTINILATEALTQGLQQVLGSTILISLMAALQLPVVLTKLAYLIDNPWTVSQVRADAAGLILADSLIDRNLGTRPITFVGYSLGSRVIFACLKELSKRGAYGLVQNVFLFGSPVVAKKDEYLRARSVVAGRFVNGYAKNDWILGYLFRLTSGGISRVAGLAPVEEIPELENIDVTEFVPGHMSYRTAMPRLLREVGFVVESDEFTEIEDPDPENHSQRQRELINEIEEARKEFEKQEKEKESKGKFGFFSRKKKAAVKKQEWETYEETKPDPAKSDSATPKHTPSSSGNDGILFDVDAMRAELATEQMEVKELKSTLPPMKLDLASPSIPSSSVPRQTLRESKIYEPGGMLTVDGYRSSASLSPRISSSNDYAAYGSSDYNTSRLILHQTGFGQEEEIQMTFDEPYQSKSTNSSIKHLPALPSPMPSPRLRETEVNLQRPELKTSSTTPSTLPSMSFGHNAWADDDEFGAEKEIQMTFA